MQQNGHVKILGQAVWRGVKVCEYLGFIYTVMIMQIIIDPPHNKTNKMACTPSIRVFAVNSMGS